MKEKAQSFVAFMATEKKKLKKNPLARCILKKWLQQYCSSHILLYYDLDIPLIKRGGNHAPPPETWWACDCGRSGIMWLLKIDDQRWYSFHLVLLRHLPLEPWAAPYKMSKAVMLWVCPDDTKRPIQVSTLQPQLRFLTTVRLNS